MAVCDALGQCEAKPECTRPCREERSKYPFAELGRNAGAGIQDLEADGAGRYELLHLQLDLCCACACLERVVEQSGQCAQE